jgi:hypothetical protein
MFSDLIGGAELYGTEQDSLDSPIASTRRRRNR